MAKRDEEDSGSGGRALRMPGMVEGSVRVVDDSLTINLVGIYNICSRHTRVQLGEAPSFAFHFLMGYSFGISSFFLKK